MRKRDREDSERADVPGDLNIACHKVMPCLVIEEVRRNSTSDPRPVSVVAGTTVCPRPTVRRTNSGEGRLESRHAGRAAIRKADDDAVEQQVDGTRCARRARGVPSDLGRGQHAVAETAGDARRPKRLEISRAREAEIDRFEPLGGVEEKWDGVRAASEVQCDLSAETYEHRSVELVQGSCAYVRENGQRILRRAGQLLGRGGLEPAPRSVSGLGCERRGALKKGASRGEAAAHLRSAGRALQLPRDSLIRCKGGLSAMPGPAIGIRV